MLQIKLLRPESKAPTRAHASDAGLDLIHIGRKLTIKAGAKVKIATGFAMSIPLGNVAKVYPRSGLGTKQELVLANLVGIIDSDYRDEVFVTMKNNGSDDVVIEKGDRFAQMVIQPVWLWSPQIVEKLPDSVRNTGGHGSTGK